MRRQHASSAKQSSHTTSSTRLGLLFCFLVFVLISIALVYKGILLLQKSVYENNHQFSILVTDPTAQQEIIAVDPVGKKTTNIVITSPHHTPGTIELGIPVDVVLQANYSVSYTKSLSSQFSSFLSHYPQIKTRMTIIDLLRLYLLSKTIAPEDSAEKTLSSFHLSDDDAAYLHEHLADQEMVQEGKTIQILNASGVSGAGGTVEKMINRVGGSVIAVNTARDEENKTHIEYAGEKTYTVEKLEKLFQVPAEKTTEQTISDIIILLGKDHPLLIH